MDIISAYREVGTYRGAAVISGTTPKTVKRVIARHDRDQVPPAGGSPVRVARVRNYESVTMLVAERVAKTRGRISAKRLLPAAQAAGYGGSARNFRRLVAEQKALWRRDNPRGRRPAVWSPGEHLVIDWGVLDGLHVFCAVLAWSRVRFVRFAEDERGRDDDEHARRMLRTTRRGPRGGPRGPDGLPERRCRRERGRADTGLRRFRGALWISA